MSWTRLARGIRVVLISNNVRMKASGSKYLGKLPINPVLNCLPGASNINAKLRNVFAL